MIIAVIGATGLVGRDFIIEALANTEISQVITFSRSSLNISSDKLNENIAVDFTNLPQVITANSFVCCLGTTIKTAGSKEAFRIVDHDYVVAFANLAKKNNAKSLHVISALGANEKSPLFYNKVKGEMEKDVALISIGSTYFYHPSLLIGNREEKRFGESIAISIFNKSEKFLPKFIKNKLGTKINDISKKILENIFNLEDGIHHISDFSNSSFISPFDKMNLSPELVVKQRIKRTYDSSCMSVCNYDEAGKCQTCSMYKTEKTQWKIATNEEKSIMANNILKRVK